jgi:hypothetical protein
VTLTETAPVERTAPAVDIVHYACCHHDSPPERPVRLLCGKDATDEELREHGGQVCVVCEDDAKAMLHHGAPCPVEKRTCELAEKARRRQGRA